MTKVSKEEKMKRKIKRILNGIEEASSRKHHYFFTGGSVEIRSLSLSYNVAKHYNPEDPERYIRKFLEKRPKMKEIVREIKEEAYKDTKDDVLNRIRRIKTTAKKLSDNMYEVRVRVDFARRYYYREITFTREEFIKFLEENL